MSKDLYDIREFALSRLTFKTFPDPDGYDDYIIHIYWKGHYLTKIRVDAIEVDCFRHGDNGDGEENELGFREDVDFEKKPKL